MHYSALHHLLRDRGSLVTFHILLLAVLLSNGQVKAQVYVDMQVPEYYFLDEISKFGRSRILPDYNDFYKPRLARSTVTALSDRKQIEKIVFNDKGYIKSHYYDTLNVNYYYEDPFTIKLLYKSSLAGTVLAEQVYFFDTDSMLRRAKYIYYQTLRYSAGDTLAFTLVYDSLNRIQRTDLRSALSKDEVPVEIYRYSSLELCKNNTDVFCERYAVIPDAVCHMYRSVSNDLAPSIVVDDVIGNRRICYGQSANWRFVKFTPLHLTPNHFEVAVQVAYNAADVDFTFGFKGQFLNGPGASSNYSTVFYQDAVTGNGSIVETYDGTIADVPIKHRKELVIYGGTNGLPKVINKRVDSARVKPISFIYKQTRHD